MIKALWKLLRMEEKPQYNQHSGIKFLRQLKPIVPSSTEVFLEHREKTQTNKQTLTKCTGDVQPVLNW